MCLNEYFVFSFANEMMYLWLAKLIIRHQNKPSGSLGLLPDLLPDMTWICKLQITVDFIYTSCLSTRRYGSKRMSSRDSLPVNKLQTSAPEHQSSTGSAQPQLTVLPPERRSAELVRAPLQGRRLSRPRSASTCLPGASRTGSSQDASYRSGAVQKEFKLPPIPRRKKSDSSVEIRTARSSTPVYRSISCVLPDVSGKKGETKFGITPLRQQDVEKASCKFDPLESKSQHLVKYFRDQTWSQRD